MIHVVETTDGQVFLGRLAVSGDRLEVKSGFQGHPVMLDPQDVLSVVPADDHPDTEELHP